MFNQIRQGGSALPERFRDQGHPGAVAGGVADGFNPLEGHRGQQPDDQGAFLADIVAECPRQQDRVEVVEG